MTPDELFGYITSTDNSVRPCLEHASKHYLMEELLHMDTLRCVLICIIIYYAWKAVIGVLYRVYHPDGLVIPLSLLSSNQPGHL